MVPKAKSEGVVVGGEVGERGGVGREVRGCEALLRLSLLTI